MTRTHTRTAMKTGLSLSALALVITGAVLYAGPLDPPAGPVTGTYKTLAEVEPRIAINATNTPGDADSLFKITQPGSYYLTGNITGVVGKHGIEIAASGVTLDLNGFDLVGVPAMGTFDGVSVTVVGLSNIAVVNGSIRAWGDKGVDLLPFLASNCRVEGVLAGGNTGGGITTGSGCTITGCAAYQNAGAGISTGSGCSVTNCTAYQNTGNGITASSGCMVSNCTAQQNTVNGILTGSGCTVTDCTVYLNTVNGITTSNGSTVSNCSALDNTGNGITTTNGSTVSNCSAYSNTGNGISVLAGCTVADCTVRLNTLDGIVSTSQCVIRGNTCSNNGIGAGDGAGIHTTGADTRIEGNTCTGADRGIDVDLGGNIIIRNTCAGNTTDWDIVANNVFGPIIDRRGAPGIAAVVGFSAPDSTGSTHPNANFSY